MRAMTVEPGRKGSAGVGEVPDVESNDGTLLVAGLAIGVCGTDREIASGAYGTSPPGETTLIVGHESLGEVRQAPPRSGFTSGDLVVGIVRRPDPVPCPACAAGEWDMCRNDKFGERGIVRLHGYGSEFWKVEPDFAVPIPATLGDIGVLLEPASVLAKAWDQVDQISRRAFFHRGRALVTGAGPIGLMACLLGAQRGYEMHVVDLAVGGPKQDLVEHLGARYHAGDAVDIDVDVDVIIECTGLGAVGRSAATRLTSGGIMCLTGIMNLDPTLDVDATTLNRNMVLHNQVLFGTVNAGRRHWEQAAAALSTADPTWLAGLITRRVPLTQWTDALERQPEDIKVIVDLTT
jgi:threonine dehydrogenase-like Zn-dependent dehydrogenase